MKQIKLSSDFTELPGGRYKAEGDFSGEKFREEILEKALKESADNHEELLIDLDGTYGYGSSFLEEAFGGLVRKIRKDKKKTDKKYLDAIQKIILKTEEEPELKEKIMQYINEALKQK